MHYKPSLPVALLASDVLPRVHRYGGPLESAFVRHISEVLEPHLAPHLVAEGPGNMTAFKVDLLGGGGFWPDLCVKRPAGRSSSGRDLAGIEVKLHRDPRRSALPKVREALGQALMYLHRFEIGIAVVGVSKHASETRPLLALPTTGPLAEAMFTARLHLVILNLGAGR